MSRRARRGKAWAVFASWLCLSAGGGCQRSEPLPHATAEVQSGAEVQPGAGLQPGAGQAPARVQSAQPTDATEPCPAGKLRVAGGSFWMGDPEGAGLPDERPAFSTRVPDLCVDKTEVTVAAFEACAAAGRCSAKRRPRLTCNYGRPERTDHPMNCVTWQEAHEFCQANGARLPSEVEWEYFAKGGAEGRKFPWGDESPDGHACWKRNLSCPVGSYPAGAFGLFDVVGNVWEWTSSEHAAYPWPGLESPHKIYRGGGWSRRFDKWMLPTLRNWSSPTEMGSHLGFRCVQLAPAAACPYGRAEESNRPGANDQISGSCLHGVDAVSCDNGTTWNGARCASPGEPQCLPGTRFRPGYGCVGADGGAASGRAHGGSAHGGKASGHAAKKPHQRAPAEAAVSGNPSPALDADCRRFQPTRPRAFRVQGGAHEDRNAWAAARGCKNRDVGGSWNSVCCP